MNSECVFFVFCRVCLCAVPVSVRGPPPQRYSRAKCAVPHCARPAPQSLDCVRERSLPGPPHFASLRSAAGAVGRAVGTGARRFSARLHSATANPPSSATGNPSAATARLAWSRCLPAPIASVPAASCPSRRRIRSGPVAGTPRPCALVAHVRFCGARSAPLRVSKVRALPLDCAEDLLDIRSVWLFPRMAQSWDTMQKCDLLLHDNAFMKCQSQTRRYPQRFCGAACTNATR